MVPVWARLHNPPGSFGGRQPAYSAVQPHMVVVVAPEPQHKAGMAERDEQRFIEAFVAQPALAALDVAVLAGLAWCDVVPLDAPILRPLQDRQAGQLGAVAHGEAGSGMVRMRCWRQGRVAPAGFIKAGRSLK
jgi:hypothetical protein